MKPSVEYLDSLNDYRKRSRSAEVSAPDRGLSKTPRLNGYDSPHSALPPESEPVVAAETEMVVESSDDPTVYGKFLVFTTTCPICADSVSL